jgi:hypothetical protein
MMSSPPDAIPVNSGAPTDYCPPGSDISSFEVGYHAGTDGTNFAELLTECCPCCHHVHRLYTPPSPNPADGRFYLQFICYGKGYPGTVVQLEFTPGPLPQDALSRIAAGLLIGS